jgi:hypothetical protein
MVDWGARTQMWSQAPQQFSVNPFLMTFPNMVFFYVGFPFLLVFKRTTNMKLPS